MLFEALALALIERDSQSYEVEMPVNRVVEILKVNPQRIWTIFNHWISKTKATDDPGTITQLGVDKTSTKKGQVLSQILIKCRAALICGHSYSAKAINCL